MDWKFEYLILLPLGYSLLQGIQTRQIVAQVKTQLEVLQNNVSIMNHKFDVFLKSEIDTLKDIAQSVRK